MEQIKINEIEVDHPIQYFDHKDQKWYLAEIILIGINFVHILGVTGSLADTKWTENYTNLADPDFYLTYQEIPEPPQKPKKRRMITPTIIVLIIFTIIAIINIIVTIIFR